MENDCIHSIPNPYYGGGSCWALDESKICTDIPYPDISSGAPSDDITDDATDGISTEYDIPTEPTEHDMQFDIQSLLDSMGISMKHAKYAIIILIVIFIMSRLA